LTEEEEDMYRGSTRPYSALALGLMLGTITVLARALPV